MWSLRFLEVEMQKQTTPLKKIISNLKLTIKIDNNTFRAYLLILPGT